MLSRNYINKVSMKRFKMNLLGQFLHNYKKNFHIKHKYKHLSLLLLFTKKAAQLNEQLYYLNISINYEIVFTFSLVDSSCVASVSSVGFTSSTFGVSSIGFSSIFPSILVIVIKSFGISKENSSLSSSPGL